MKLFSSRAGSALLSFPSSTSQADVKSSPRGAFSAGSTLSDKTSQEKADGGAEADSSAMNWMVQSMSEGADAKTGSHAGDASSAGAFPLPKGRPSRPPVAMHKAGPPASVVSSAAASSVATHAISGSTPVSSGKLFAVEVVFSRFPCHTL